MALGRRYVDRRRREREREERVDNDKVKWDNRKKIGKFTNKKLRIVKPCFVIVSESDLFDF